MVSQVACTPPEPAEEVEFHIPVSVEEVRIGPMEDHVVATGTLRAPRKVTLNVETAGILTFARGPSGGRWQVGDRVAAGSVIASIEAEDIRLSAGTAARAQAFDAAKRGLAAKQRLFGEGLISQLEINEAEVKLAETELAWKRSRRIEDWAQVVTPIRGVILRLAQDAEGVPIGEGQRVDAGFVVATIAPISELVAEVHVVGPDISRIRVGQTARVRHYTWGERVFDGRVVRLAPELDPVTRTFSVELVVPNPEQLLLPGMFVEATVVVERREGALLVPRGGVTERGGRSIVFVLDSQRVYQREVVLGLASDQLVEVRQGVELGMRVVVQGLETLTDQTRVRVINR